MDAVGGGGDVPMVEQNATALVAGDADVDLRIWAEEDLGVAVAKLTVFGRTLYSILHT